VAQVDAVEVADGEHRVAERARDVFDAVDHFHWNNEILPLARRF
jgi:hypothetical protein